MPETETPSPLPEKQKRKNRKKAERKFDGSDAEYTAHSRVKHKHFTVHLPQFTAFDPDLDLTYATNWFAKIEACEALTPDETTMHEMAGYKEKLDKKIIELIAKISGLEFYAQKAFKDEPEVLYEFQFNKVQRLDQYDVNFIVNCIVIRMIADVDYYAELLAVGMPPTFVDELDTIANDAASIEIFHEKFKRIRIQRTRIRIKEMNQLFDTTDAVRKAALVIFADKPELRVLWG